MLKFSDSISCKPLCESLRYGHVRNGISSQLTFKVDKRFKVENELCFADIIIWEN